MNVQQVVRVVSAGIREKEFKIIKIKFDELCAAVKSLQTLNAQMTMTLNILDKSSRLEHVIETSNTLLPLQTAEVVATSSPEQSIHKDLTLDESDEKKDSITVPQVEEEGIESLQEEQTGLEKQITDSLPQENGVSEICATLSVLDSPAQNIHLSNVNHTIGTLELLENQQLQAEAIQDSVNIHSEQSIVPVVIEEHAPTVPLELKRKMRKLPRRI